jgi:hypothetical protein
MGIANSDSVAITNQIKVRYIPLVSGGRVTANDSLLKLMAATETVSAVAP